jgi:hypothetical protein
MHLCAYKIHMAFTHKPFKYFNPKQQMRFELLMYDSLFNGTFFPTYAIKSAERPTLDNNPITVDYINTEFKVKGKSRWNPISVRFYDPIEINGAKKLHDYINNYHHNSGTYSPGSNLLTPGEDGFIHEYKRTLYLRSLSPHGDVVDSFILVGAFFESVKWGEYDMSNDDLVLMEGTIVYDYAIVTGSEISLQDPDGIHLPGISEGPTSTGGSGQSGGANIGKQLLNAGAQAGRTALNAGVQSALGSLGGIASRAIGNIGRGRG